MLKGFVYTAEILTRGRRPPLFNILDLYFIIISHCPHPWYQNFFQAFAERKMVSEKDV